VSQFESNQHLAHKKKYLGELFNFPEGTMAVGRLDEPSEGLLILTTDGHLSQKLRSRAIEKEYWAQLDGLIGESDLQRFEDGLEINIEGKKYFCKAIKVNAIPPPNSLQSRRKSIRDDRHGPTSWISLVLREGKFRQVRKMTAMVGYPTLRLIRVRVGQYHLKGMKAGECRAINSSQLVNLLSL